MAVRVSIISKYQDVDVIHCASSLIRTAPRRQASDQTRPWHIVQLSVARHWLAAQCSRAVPNSLAELHWLAEHCWASVQCSAVAEHYRANRVTWTFGHLRGSLRCSHSYRVTACWRTHPQSSRK
mmetsp:Transcript_24183/g.64900  ORF Transcript_24183/g.64900 Transcript_24183/m.64900 type:complete len:124 (-) Transcript_24183:156-527(-)